MLLTWRFIVVCTLIMSPCCLHIDHESSAHDPPCQTRMQTTSNSVMLRVSHCCCFCSALYLAQHALT
jgi:fructose/tagatose bisphosphate aldolase